MGDKAERLTRCPRDAGCDGLNGNASCTFKQWVTPSDLAPSAISRWAAGWKPNVYSRGNILFYKGNTPLGVYFVCTGCVKLVRGDRGGRHQILRLISAPEFLGERALIAQQPYEATAEVVDEARICFIDASRFQRLWDVEPEVSRILARRLASRLGETQELLAEMGLHTVRERLARLIARGHEASRGSAKPVALGGSRQELAERLGTSVEVVCRTLTELSRKGLIALQGRSARVLNETRLRAAAGLPPR